MIGSMIGAHRITDMLGDGGLGPVYLASDPSGGTVAVRVFSAEIGRDPSLMERLRRILPLLQHLQHPNIGAVYDLVGVGGSAGMLVEYLPGATLDGMRRRSGTVAVNVAVSCAVQALRGLEHAHASGLFHHAIRPTNLMATPRGTVRLMDFGIGHAFGANRKTREDRLLQVMAYLAPEQIRNQAGDARADIYAVGVVLFELITGRLPFDHRTEFALMQGQLNEPPAAPGTLVAGVPAWLDGAVLRALGKQPEHRFQTASEMRGVLEAGLGLSTSGSAAVVRGAAGGETVSMFTDAPPIPGAATVGMSPDATVAMPGLGAPGDRSGGTRTAESASPEAVPPATGSGPPAADDETIVLPAPDFVRAAPAPPGPVASPAAGRPEDADATIVLGPAGSAPGTAPDSVPQASHPAAATPRPAETQAFVPVAATAEAPTSQPVVRSPQAGPAATSPRQSSRLVMALATAAVVLAGVVAGLWWATRPSPPADAPDAGEMAAAEVPGAEPAGTLPADGSQGVDAGVPAAAAAPDDVPPPASTMPPPAEPEPTPPSAPRPRPRPAPARTAAAPPAPEPTREAAAGRPPAAEAVSAPAAPLALPRPRLPDLSFQKVKLVTEQDGKPREIDVQLMFLAERMALAPARGGAIFRSVPYQNVRAADYTKAEKRRLFIRSAQHMFTIDEPGGQLLLRLDKENVEPILQAFEARTGRTVTRDE